MLKILNITFQDSKNNELVIDGNHVESFPLIGGEEANMVNTKVWNQHGNTHVAAYMESFEGELVFIIPSFGLTNQEIIDRRKSITNICNPLNKTVVMKIALNTGQVFNRDITFVAAPVFPIGLDNRNSDWQKVQLLYEANNPFWYEEEGIVETFQTVEPLFLFPFTMSTTAPVNFGNLIPTNIATNEGQVEAPVMIRIVGSCINPIIDNKTTGEFIKFKNLTMGALDELIIDTTFGQKKVELNGQNVFNKLDFDSTFFNLSTGDNEIEFTDETGTNAASIHFIYRHLYITI
jgi:hypothetical protein